MRVFVVKAFSRFQRKERIEDDALRDAIDRAERGLVDADLGNGLIKQRVARQGQGRSGGYRTILAYRESELAFFLKGFAKSSQANITGGDKKLLVNQAKALMGADADLIETLILDGDLSEVDYDDDDN